MTKRDMIVRLLLNLKGAYLRANEDESALAAVDRLLLITPDDPDQVRDRGLLLYRLQRHGPALDGLTDYLRRLPDAPDRESIEAHVATLRQIVASLN
ncbi:MAG: tetratricopeptide repeat protein [Candidatus Eisenbacteria bacterium]|uniref:Tetratricopeptide repeat protein n=1 Tax=Eiseniibacteriota bacterium TaxID=2212470 RepID=A0A9D6LA74_UNCEI|nr:tetratricopeptide repeat protein [Candidatus Eisenbacteria bacterium]